MYMCIYLIYIIFSERDIPHRDTPGTFLFINLNSKYFIPKYSK